MIANQPVLLSFKHVDGIHPPIRVLRCQLEVGVGRTHPPFDSFFVAAQGRLSRCVAYLI
ncbi:MAG: hypothetical protein ACETWG_02850 [Candidatus Neomarinimicrobiota bacterium]